MNTSQPNVKLFYTIPGQVMDDERLHPEAKLLYALIVSLCYKQGYCWASNKYFMGRLGRGRTQVKDLLKNLKDNGYIESTVSFKEDSCEVESRYIRLSTIVYGLPAEVPLPSQQIPPLGHEHDPAGFPVRPESINTLVLKNKDTAFPSEKTVPLATTNAAETTAVAKGTAQAVVEDTSISSGESFRKAFPHRTGMKKLYERKVTPDMLEAFNWWNDLKIIVHRTPFRHRDAIKLKRAVNTWPMEFVKKAMSNYATVLYGKDYYFSHKWTLWEFCDSHIEKFFDSSEPLKFYRANKGNYKSTKKSKTVEELYG